LVNNPGERGASVEKRQGVRRTGIKWRCTDDETGNRRLTTYCGRGQRVRRLNSKLKTGPEEILGENKPRLRGWRTGIERSDGLFSILWARAAPQRPGRLLPEFPARAREKKKL